MGFILELCDKRISLVYAPSHRVHGTAPASLPQVRCLICRYRLEGLKPRGIHVEHLAARIVRLDAIGRSAGSVLLPSHLSYQPRTRYGRSCVRSLSCVCRSYHVTVIMPLRRSPYSGRSAAFVDVRTNGLKNLGLRIAVFVVQTEKVGLNVPFGFLFAALQRILWLG